MGHAKTQPGFCLKTGGRDSFSEALGNTSLLQAGGQILKPVRSPANMGVSGGGDGTGRMGINAAQGSHAGHQMWEVSGNSLALLSLMKS